MATSSHINALTKIKDYLETVGALQNAAVAIIADNLITIPDIASVPYPTAAKGLSLFFKLGKLAQSSSIPSPRKRQGGGRLLVAQGAHKRFQGFGVKGGNRERSYWTHRSLHV